MLLVRVIKRLAGNKILPLGARGGRGQKLLHDQGDAKEFEVVKGDFTPVVQQTTAPTKGNSATHIKRVNTTVSKAPVRRKTRSIPTTSRSITTSGSSSTGDDSASTHSADYIPRKVLGEVFAPFKGTHATVDRYLNALEKVEDIIWSSLMMDEASCEAAQFSTLDPSAVPPPDPRFPTRILPVETLLKAMILAKELEQLVKNDPRALELIGSINNALLRSPEHESKGEKRVSEHTKEFLGQVFARVMDLDLETRSECYFDEQILVRLCSVIRYHLRIALNPSGKFSPIVLATSDRMFGNNNLMDARDVPRMELNVAALLHRALIVLNEDLEEGFDIQAALTFRSAKKFITNVLACASRIENVDEKRKRSWYVVQRYCCDLKRLFPNEMCEFALLGDLADLRRKLALRNTTQEISMVEVHREALKNQRTTASDLRSSRAAMTGLIGKNGHFPEVTFILDA